MKVRTWIGGLGIIAIASTLVGAVLAAPDDSKTIPGGACRAAVGGSYGDGLWHVGAGLINLGSSSKTVFCPLVTDNHANTSGLTGVEGIGNTGLTIWVQNGTSTTSCTAYSYNWNGTQQDFVTLSEAGSGVRDIQTSGLNISAVGASYSLVCVVPPNGGIFKITYVEDAG